MAFASSYTANSTSAPLQKYDVFLSFRGEDTRKGFTDHLYNALKQKGIIVFRDDEKLVRGEYISEELLKAIEESEYAIIIISENYAFSKWCLNELTEIVKCKRKNQLTILPVFYHVDPSDIRNHKGIFAEVFTNHRKVPKVNIELWSDALKEVGNIAGWRVHDRYESTIVKEICGMIFGGLNRCLSNIFKDVVGIESQVKKMMTIMRVGANDVHFIGIYGIGGIGKTTLANVIFERVSSEFEASCFVDDVREEVKKLGIVCLQRQLISEILNNREIEIWNFSGAIKVIKNRLRNKRVFIVLDNVNEETQLKALAGNHEWFGQGSRILITSRDKHLLKRHVDETYEVNELSGNDALRLFSLKAFKEFHPRSNFVNLSKNIVEYAGGLPLALEVLGSLLFGKGINVWENALDRLKEELDANILDKLIISFDDLSYLQKELFLDIACFFNKMEKNMVVRNLKSLGHYPDFDIEVLEDKSLIKVFNGQFHIHDMLQEMGHQIVRQKSFRDPGAYSRLWCHEDILYVLKNNTGTDAIQGIVLNLPLPKPMKLSFESFSKMKKLKMLVIRPKTFGRYNTSNDKTFKYLSTVEWQGDPSKFMLNNELRILEWWGYPLEYLPTNFEPNNLVELKMPMSSIKQLWNTTKIFQKLKYIDFTDSQNLIEMLDFNKVPYLEEFNVKGTAISQLSFPMMLPNKHNVLCIGGSFSRPTTILLHDLSLCLKFLKRLDMSYCNLLDGALPTDFSSLSLLEDLNLSGNKFSKIGGISQLSNLKSLVLKNCGQLNALPPKLPSSLGYVSLQNCPSFRFINLMDIWTSSELLVTAALSLVAFYFGYKGKHVRALHVDQFCATSYYKSWLMYDHIEETVTWGPTLTFDIPKWFNQRSTSLPDTSGMFQCRMDFDLCGNLANLDDRWGYALFIVYEVFNPTGCKRKRETQKCDEDGSSRSTIFPVFVCELQVKKVIQKFPIAFRVPEVPSVGRNGVWLFINSDCFYRIHFFTCRLLDEYLVSYSITISSMNVKVIECGGHLVHKHDRPECYEIIKSISPHGLDSETLKNAFYPSYFELNGPIRGLN